MASMQAASGARVDSASSPASLICTGVSTGLRVKQGYHRFGLRHLRLFDEAEDYPLYLLATKWNFHQVTRLHHPLQLGGQVVVKCTAHLRDVDRDFYIDGHLIRGSIFQPYQA